MEYYSNGLLIVNTGSFKLNT